MLTYHETSWAVRRWDWLNGGRVVKPRSFCQFWRGVLVRASIKWLLWFLAYLPCCVARLSGGATLGGVVTVGKRVDAFSMRHKWGLQVIFYGGVGVYVAGGISIIIASSAGWFWTLLILGAIALSISAGYGLFRCGALGLLWQAAVATHHGVCPPIEIKRRSE